mgnify:CR=1 FL=1
MQRESVACINNFLHHHPLNLPHPPRHPLRQFVESLYELIRVEAFAESRGYPVVFIDTGRQKKRFLKEQGFHQIPGQMLAEKRVI